VELGVEIHKDKSNNSITSFPYNPQFVGNIKIIKRHSWNPYSKYWSFQNTDGILERILKIFEGEKIYIDPFLESKKFP